MIPTNRLQAAVLAQILGQIVTAWALVAHLFDPKYRILAVGFLFVATLVPFRHDGSHRDRATGNFAAALTVVGTLFWEILYKGIDGILGPDGFSLSIAAMLMLTAGVLFSVSGAFFWTLENRSDSAH